MLSANNQPSDLSISRQDEIWHHWTFQNRRRRKDESVQPLCQGSASILQLCQEGDWHVSKVLRVIRKNWRIIEIQFRFLRGNCPFSALSCPYSHNKDQAPLCLRWKAGECTGAMGNKCVYRQVVDRWGYLLRAVRRLTLRWKLQILSYFYSFQSFQSIFGLYMMKQYVVKLRKLFPQFYTVFFVFDVTPW